MAREPIHAEHRAVPLDRSDDPPASLTRAGSLGFVIALLAVEASLFAAAFLLHIPPLAGLAAHLCVVAVFAVWAWTVRARSADASPIALALLATLVAGAVGAAYAVAAVLMLKRDAARPERLDDWYERIALAGTIDPVTRLANTVEMGRAVVTSDTVPRAFEAVMRDGSLGDRQTALGLIARRFSTAYAPALKAALVGEEPVIRVQAAAVAVKVRAEMKAAVKAALAAEGRPQSGALETRADLARTLGDMMGSGLLDDDDLAAADALVGRLADQIGAEAVLSDFLDPLDQSRIETELLRQGKYAAFRRLRARAPGLMAEGAKPHA